jgi:hypothetical protein
LSVTGEHGRSPNQDRAAPWLFLFNSRCNAAGSGHRGIARIKWPIVVVLFAFVVQTGELDTIKCGRNFFEIFADYLVVRAADELFLIWLINDFFQ